jgi:hypothetical protein
MSEGAIEIAGAVTLTGIRAAEITNAARKGRIAGAQKSEDGRTWTFTRIGLRDWKLSRRKLFYHR